MHDRAPAGGAGGAPFPDISKSTAGIGARPNVRVYGRSEPHHAAVDQPYTDNPPPPLLLAVRA